MTPRSWKQSAATGVDARNLSMRFTARHKHSKDRRKCLCTGMSQLTSVHRASAVNCKKNQDPFSKYSCVNFHIAGILNINRVCKDIEMQMMKMVISIKQSLMF